jgi:hypothetical protein
MPVTVMRRIPQKCLQGLADGSLLQKAGAIYRKHGGIYAQFQAASPEALAKFANQLAGLGGGGEGLQMAIRSLTALSQATVVLSGLNLAVSIAGFAVVCSKLNQMNAKLCEIDDKLDRLLVGQAHVAWRQEIEQRAKLEANLENLALALRTGREHLAEDAIARLNECATVHRMVCGNLLTDVRRVYLDPEPLSESTRFVVGCRLAQAHALAHMGHPQESVRLLDEGLKGQRTQLAHIEEPLRRRHVWLGRHPADLRAACRELILCQRVIPSGLEYAKAQYQFCIAYGLDENFLAEAAEGRGVVLLVPKQEGKKRG